MAKAVIMPKFGFTQETAEVVAWLKNEGDFVEAGEPIMEVETDKVTMEVEAPAEGILAGLRVAPGDVVPVTEIIAYILAPGEALPDEAAAPPPAAVQAAPPPPEPGPSAAPEATPLAARMARAEGVDLAQVAGTGPRGRVTKHDVRDHLSHEGNGKRRGGRVPATPAARRAADEAGIDLSMVAGSGPGGRVQEADVLNAAAALLAAPQPARAAAPAADADGVAQRIPFNSMRRAIARNLSASWQQAPHITFQVDVDMTGANALVDYAAQHAPEGVRVTLTAVIVRALAWALRGHPLLNSYLQGEEVLVMADVNVGVAVALENGLVVPVVKQADRRGIYDIAAELRRLGRAAREGKLRPDDMAGGTFSLSNLGMYGVDRFTAIINPPQVGILAVGRTRPVFVPDAQQQPVLRPLANLTLSVDHRVIDGAVAAAFLTDLGQALTHPERILL